MSTPNSRNRKTAAKCNHRFAKTYDPNHEPWLTMEEIESILASQQERKNNQNGSAKGE